VNSSASLLINSLTSNDLKRRRAVSQLNIKIPSKNLVRQRCAEGFNSDVKLLNQYSTSQYISTVHHSISVQYITVYQYSKTNMMHFLFSLLTIKVLYMFRALLTHYQEVLHKWYLVYRMRVMSVGCSRIEAKLQSCCSQLT
jgi:hypothetical protein